MRLVQRSLEGRAFVIQFHEIMEEFGKDIPWLDSLKGLVFSTNGRYVRDRILETFRCEDPSDIVPIQFVTSDRGSDYTAGMILFRRSPEQLADPRNRAVCEELTALGYPFLSCFQVREVLRNQGHGPDLIKRVLATLLESHGKMHWIVSSLHQAHWYQAMGATLQSPLVNQDGLWILSYNKDRQHSRLLR